MSNIAHDPRKVVCYCSICCENRQAVSDTCDELTLQYISEIPDDDEYKDWDVTLLDGLESED